MEKYERFDNLTILGKTENGFSSSLDPEVELDQVRKYLESKLFSINEYFPVFNCKYDEEIQIGDIQFSLTEPGRQEKIVEDYPANIFLCQIRKNHNENQMIIESPTNLFSKFLEDAIRNYDNGKKWSN